MIDECDLRFFAVVITALEGPWFLTASQRVGSSALDQTQVVSPLVRSDTARSPPHQRRLCVLRARSPPAATRRAGVWSSPSRRGMPEGAFCTHRFTAKPSFALVISVVADVTRWTVKVRS